MCEENYVGVDDAKEVVHDKRWDIYVNEKGKLFKGGYLVEVFGHDKKKVLWVVVDSHVIEEPTDREEIGLWGFDYIFLKKMNRGLLEKCPISFHIY